MRKQLLKILPVSVVIVIATVSAFYFMTNHGQKFKTFKGINSAFDFTFKYPAEGWNVVETKGRTENYNMVHATGPRDNEKEFSTGFFISVRQIPRGQTVDNLLDAFTMSVERFKDFKIIEKKKKQIAGQLSPFAVYQYTLMLPLNKINAEKVSMKMESGFLVRNDKYYNWNFVGTEEQYKKYRPDFKKVLSTFKFA